MILISSQSGSFEPDAQLLKAMRADGETIKIVANGHTRFDGSYGELLALGIPTRGLAGEHPVERIIKELTKAATPGHSSGRGAAPPTDPGNHLAGCRS